MDPIADKVRPLVHFVDLSSLIQGDSEPPFLLMGHIIIQDDRKAAAAFCRTLRVGLFMYGGPKHNLH